jgi:hypothetical protein
MRAIMAQVFFGGSRRWHSQWRLPPTLRSAPCPLRGPSAGMLREGCLPFGYDVANAASARGPEFACVAWGFCCIVDGTGLEVWRARNEWTVEMHEEVCATHELSGLF